VGDDVRTIFIDWITYLKSECLTGNDNPIFPKTKMSHGNGNNFQADGLTNEHWRSAAAIRKIFKYAFTLAELPSFNPHSFRNTLTTLGEKVCRSPEEFKAWSQNFGHDKALTTFSSYGEVQEERQADIFKEFNKPRAGVASPDVTELAKAIAKEMAN
jgi:integrase/recombinase XerD